MADGTRTGTAGRARAVPPLGWERRTALAGLAGTAVAFGPARMAFGMLLPQIRGDFGLTAAAAGLIASAAFAAFAAALVAASLATRRLGAKLPVVAGGAFALGGAGLATVAGSTPVLAAGVVAAAASAGLCWTPFNAVAGRLVRARRRDRVLSIVSTGTTLGIVAMGLGALVLAWTGASWRWVWGATALGGGVAGLTSLLLLPPSRRLVPRRTTDMPAPSAGDVARRLLRREARPLLGAAAAFGVVSAAFSTFAVDHLAGRGAASGPATGGLVFLAFGALGAVGFRADAIERRLGLRGAVAASFAAAGAGTAALALAPGSWTAALAGAGLVGASVMVFSVLMSVASLRLFPGLPVMGMTAAVLATSAGSVAGPAAAGVLADAAGTGAALGAAAGLAGLSAAAVLAARAGGGQGRA